MEAQKPGRALARQRPGPCLSGLRSMAGRLPQPVTRWLRPAAEGPAAALVFAASTAVSAAISSADASPRTTVSTGAVPGPACGPPAGRPAR